MWETRKNWKEQIQQKVRSKNVRIQKGQTQNSRCINKFSKLVKPFCQIKQIFVDAKRKHAGHKSRIFPTIVTNLEKLDWKWTESCARCLLSSWSALLRLAGKNLLTFVRHVSFNFNLFNSTYLAAIDVGDNKICPSGSTYNSTADRCCLTVRDMPRKKIVEPCVGKYLNN